MLIIVFIAMGAIIGALSRYYLGVWAVQKWQLSFPYPTLGVNLTGAFLMGFLANFFVNQWSIEVQKLILVGFLGSYTTFSSYILDSFKFFNEKRYLVALLYWVGCPILGLIFLELGVWLSSYLGNF